MAAGIVALVLEANANLTWRDIQHVTIRCAQSENLQATDWLINAVGRNYSHSFGYGIMDAGCMVRYIQWQSWCTNKETDFIFSDQACQDLEDCSNAKNVFS